MSVSLLKLFKSGPPPPRVVLLPDHRFFVRAVPVSAGATGPEVATQVELALETLSPFPPAQLYYGYFWTPGADRALVFASYRKRFGSDQTAEWGNAELVAPAFTALAAVEHQPATTLLVPSADGLTAIYWDNGTVPSRVLTRALPPEATEADRAQARDSLLQAAGGSRAVIDLTAAPEATASTDEASLQFRAGEFTALFPAAAAAAADVRDKGELAALRRARARDLILWRVFAGCVIALALLLVGEIAIVAVGKPWQQSLRTKAALQRPVVDKIKTANDLATHIEDMSTKRLLPIEMVTAVLNGKIVDGQVKLDPQKRGSIVFQRVTASTSQLGLYTIKIDAQTPNASELDVYYSWVQGLPFVEKAVLAQQPSRNGAAVFALTVTFKPDAIKPATEP